MSGSASGTPLALRLAARALPKEVREEVLGDLLEHWTLHVSHRRWHVRTAWAWRQPFAALAARLRWGGKGGIRHPRQDMEEGMRYKLEMEAERLVREEGLRPKEAHRRAAIAFGNIDLHGEALREGRTLAWLGGLTLDLKLGVRMLAKYPGLTVVGGLAMAFAIATGGAFFEFVSQLVYPTLPLDEGHRVVALRYWNAETGGAHSPSLQEFVQWRQDLDDVRELGAYVPLDRNLAAANVPGEPVKVAEITASAFRVTRVPPLLGRPLVEGDEERGATPVVVLGYDVWRRLFGGDPHVLGRTVRVGRVESTVVGVMPEGYGFPLYHDAWIPLQRELLPYAPGGGPTLRVFGRLAPGTSLEEARAEFVTVAGRAAGIPELPAHVRPEILPYARSYLNLSGGTGAAALSSNLLLVMFLVLVSSNVALLMFARAATREGELLVRSALGASRLRIVAQFFTEALVLGSVAAAVGLAAADLLLGAGMDAVMSTEAFPFWMRDSLASGTLIYGVLLAILGAVVAGVVPAIKVTGTGLNERLKRVASGGGSASRMGGVWTGVIVAQVAVTVAVPVHAFFIWRQAAEIRSAEIPFADREYLSARLEMDIASDGAPGREESPGEQRGLTVEVREELERRIGSEPHVLGVTFADPLPYGPHPRARVEVEDRTALPDGSADASVSVASVNTNFFDVIGTPVLQGRAFRSGDLDIQARTVVVNEAFVEHVLGGLNAVGRRVRLPTARSDVEAQPAPWHEIVGVVPNIGTGGPTDPSRGAGLYRLLQPAAPAHLVVHVRGEPETFGPRLRSIAAAVDPGLRLYRVLPLDDVRRIGMQWLIFLFRTTLVVSAVAVVLSLAGIYAVMAFTVARRTREIGVRVALGADARRVVTAVFRGPLARVGAGLLAGFVLALTYAVLAMAESLGTVAITPAGVTLLAGYVSLMLGVCLLACVVPTWRALRVEPTEALRSE